MKKRRYGNVKRKNSGYKREGRVYILSNPAMPGLIKIGYTTRNIDERIFELSSATGVPEHFILEYIYLSNSPHILEKRIHQILDSYRASKYREFFTCSPSEAVKVIKEKIDITPEDYTTKEPSPPPSHYSDYKEKFYNSLSTPNKKKDTDTTTVQKAPLSSEENWVINCNHCNHNNIQNVRPKTNENYYCKKCLRIIF